MATKKPTPKPTKKGPVYVFPDGSTVGVKDLGKVKPTPKPKPVKFDNDMNSKQYDAHLKKIIAEMKKR